MAYVHTCVSSAGDHHREVANQAKWRKNEILFIFTLVTYTLMLNTNYKGQVREKFPEEANNQSKAPKSELD